MNSYLNYVLNLKKTDLTYVTTAQNVKSLIGAVLENKQNSFLAQQVKFMENVKVLNRVAKKSDARSLALFKRTFNTCKNILENTAKLERSFIIEEQIVKNNEEFAEYISLKDNDRLIHCLLKDLEKEYTTELSCPSLGHLEEILKSSFTIRGKEDTLKVISKVLSLLEN